MGGVPELRSRDVGTKFILMNLSQGRTGIKRDHGINIVELDKAAERAIRESLADAIIPGRKTVKLQDCRTPLVPFIAFALAYELSDIDAPEEDIVLLFSKDPGCRDLSKKIVPYIGSMLPVSDFFPPAFLSANVKHFHRFTERVGALSRPRVIISDTINPGVMTDLLEHGIVPRIIVIDGRTINERNLKEIRVVTEEWQDTHILLLSPSKYQSVPGMPMAEDDRRGIGEPVHGHPGIPLLVHHRLDNITVDATVEHIDDADCIAALRRLGRFEGALVEDFKRMAWRIFRTLLAIPVRPVDLNLAWNTNVQLLEHPISAPLARLEATCDAAFTDAMDCAPNLQETIILLRQLSDSLDVRNRKSERLLEMLEQLDSALVIVNGKASALSMIRIMDGISDRISVRTWSEPPVWAPVDVPVLITSPPPPGREWIVNTPLSEDVRFHLYSTEVDLLCLHFRRKGMDRGPAWELLTRKCEMEVPEEVPETLTEADHPLYVLDNLSRVLTIDAKMKVKHEYPEGTTTTEVVPIVLSEGAMFWARPFSEMATLREGRVRYLKAVSLRENDVVVLPRNAPAEHLQHAFFDAAESIPSNQKYVTKVRNWKEEVLRYRDERGLDMEDLLGELNRKGANIDRTQLRSIFEPTGVQFRQVATRGPTDLVGASLKLTRGVARVREVNDICESISHFRGIHQNAGKYLKKLAETAFLSYDSELDTVLDTRLNLTVGDMRKHLHPFVVVQVEEEMTVPVALAGTLEIESEETD